MKNQVVYQSNLLSGSLNYAFQSYQHLSIKFLRQARKRMLDKQPFVSLSHFVSLVLGEEVSPLKSLNLVHAFIAFFCMLLLGGTSALAQLLLIVWFALTALQCKRDGWTANNME